MNICSIIMAASVCWVNNRARLVTEGWQDASGLRRCVISYRRWWIACGQEPVLPASLENQRSCCWSWVFVIHRLCVFVSTKILPKSYDVFLTEYLSVRGQSSRGNTKKWQLLLFWWINLVRSVEHVSCWAGPIPPWPPVFCILKFKHVWN